MYLAQASQTESQPVIVKPLDYGTLAFSTLIVLGVSAFFVKWLFSQVVDSWSRRIQKLEQQQEKYDREAVEIAKRDDAQQNVIAQLSRTLEQNTNQLSQLTEATRQLAVLGERQNVFDQRLQNFGGSLQDTQRLITESQKEMLAFRSHVDSNYLRREDWTRFSNVLEAKIDENNRRMGDLRELIFARGKEHE